MNAHDQIRQAYAALQADLTAVGLFALHGPSALPSGPAHAGYIALSNALHGKPTPCGRQAKACAKRIAEHTQDAKIIAAAERIIVDIDTLEFVSKRAAVSNAEFAARIEAKLND
jgi:H2-forming N5,N10-methylenetetrahydromethanopterin dehydrogenase-like enzyme